ncbi:MAG TPA: sigma-70 family RNA polymerase sigma factor [Actinospica sp.]|jgi:RNA polymerase sigma factor (sigma-70 family)|nr:sigma-70 family RNA polymerase sigma factor [Actinospica sp.]
MSAATGRSHAATGFESFAQRVWPTLHARARRLCGCHHEAEDLAQETLLVLSRRWADFDDRGRPAAYVAAVLHSRFVDARRHSRWRHERLDGFPPGRDAAAADTSGAVEQRVSLDSALAGLGVRQRDVLVLRYLCDLDVRTVSRMLCVSQSTVRSQEARALRSLRCRGGLG